MNSWFTVKVKYTKQLEDGTFKRVSEPYLLAALTFSDAETRIYEELGMSIRGEFIVNGITRTDIHEIFYFEDADTWYKCKLQYQSFDSEDGQKSKKIVQNILVSAHSVKEAHERLIESLKGMMMDFTIPAINISPIVDIFPFTAAGEDHVGKALEKQLKKDLDSARNAREIAPDGYFRSRRMKDSSEEPIDYGSDPEMLHNS